MPTKNFFPSSLAPIRSSRYPFLYTTRKTPMSFDVTGTSLNCTSLNYSPSSDLTCMLLNCNLAQTSHDMPSGLAEGLGHLRHLGLLGQWPDDMPSSHPDSSDTLGYWLDDMPSGHPDHLDPLSHLGHLSYLGLLGHLGYLNVLDPEPIESLFMHS
jgi:hypothetical protein